MNYHMKFLAWVVGTLGIICAVLCCVFLVTGDLLCGRTININKSTETMETMIIEPDDPTFEYPKHNYTTTIVPEWSVEVWTWGEIYVPWEPVDIMVRLTSTKGAQEPPATLRIHVELLDEKTGEKIRASDMEPKLREVRKQTVLSWETALSDAFHSDMREPKRKPDAAQLARGDYRITVRLIAGKRSEIRTPAMRISVDDRGGR